jgi:hypothetical protein
MSDEKEFRIGDMQREFADRAAARVPAGPGIDAEKFPTLAAFLHLAPATFKERIDRLAARAREESSPETKAALQNVVRVLPEVYKKYGG